MRTIDELSGVQKADLEEMREIKLKLPIKQLLKLHYLKMTQNRSFSDIADDALASYFEELAKDE